MFVDDRRTFLSLSGWIAPCLKKLQLKGTSWCIKSGRHFLSIWNHSHKIKIKLLIGSLQSDHLSSFYLQLQCYSKPCDFQKSCFFSLLFCWKTDWKKHSCDQQNTGALTLTVIQFTDNRICSGNRVTASIHTLTYKADRTIRKPIKIKHYEENVGII